MNSKDAEAVFAIRQARQHLHDGDVWADWMLRAVDLVGITRMWQLANNPVTDITKEPADVDLA